MESRSLVREINKNNRLHGKNGQPVKNTRAVTDNRTRTSGGKKASAYNSTANEGIGYKPRKAKTAKASAVRSGTSVKRSAARPSSGASSASRTQAARRRAARKTETTIYLIEALAVLVLVGGLVAFLLWHNAATKITLGDYLVVDVSGYDHHGTAAFHMDVDPAYSDFWDTVEIKADKQENLSNGEEINIVFSYDEETAKSSKVKVLDEGTVFTVEGLTPQIPIDHEKLFSGITVSQEGLSPRVSLTVENTSEDEFVSQVTYSIESEKNFFADGEEISISAQIPDEILETHKYAMELGEEGPSYTYTVSQPDSYIMDASYVTPDILKALEDEGTSILLNSDANEFGLRIFQQEAHIQAVFVGNRTTFRWENAYVISAYFHSVTDEGLDFIENHLNDVMIVYGVTIAQQNNAKAFAEVVVQFTNLIQRADGTIDTSESPGRIVSCTYRDNNVKKLVSGVNVSNYNTTKLTD